MTGRGAAAAAYSLQNLAVLRNLELKSAKFSVVDTQSKSMMVLSCSASTQLWCASICFIFERLVVYAQVFA